MPRKHNKKSLNNNRSASVKIPYTLDPSTLANGSFPPGWKGSSWTISSNKGVCSPTLGDELLTDGGLEANYTDNLCDSLRKLGTPTLSQSADAHGGTKAQSFLGDAQNEAIYFPAVTPTANLWYLLSVWGKRTAGANGTDEPRLEQVGGTPVPANRGQAHNSAAYAQRKVVKRSANTNVLSIFPIYTTAADTFDTVVLDDCSLKTITQSTMIALRKAKADVTAKAKYTWDQNGICGVMARANVQSNPNTFLVAYYFKQSSPYTYCILEKCVNGTWTQLIADWSNSPAAGGGDTPTATQWLEIRCSGTTVQLFHNNVQVGADQTVSDVTGVYAGVFQSGGSQLESFFVG